jgi:hypothetical protein
MQRHASRLASAIAIVASLPQAIWTGTYLVVLAKADFRVTQAYRDLHGPAWALADFMELGGVCFFMLLAPCAVFFSIKGAAMRPGSKIAWFALAFALISNAAWIVIPFLSVALNPV